MAHPRITNEREIDAEAVAAENTGFERKRLSRAAGGEKLGCSLYVLSPETESWKYHYHTANEEAIFVLDGEGRVEMAAETNPIQEGDYISFPVGEDGAHRVFNDGEKTLRYLCFSTMIEPDVSVYPESNMIGIFAGAGPGGRESERTMKKFLQADAEVDYWDDKR